MPPDPEALPESFVLPALPPALEEWFSFAASLAEDTELLHDGAITDGLRVVDAESARLGLLGYRWESDQGEWVDLAARGGWDENWVVIESVNADPIIADVSDPAVPVLEAEFGEDAWAPRRISSSLREFIDSLEVNDDSPGPPPLDPDPAAVHAVWAIDGGPRLFLTLVQLRNWPAFLDLSHTQMLRIRASLPALVDDGLDEEEANDIVEQAAGFGATFEVRSAGGTPANRPDGFAAGGAEYRSQDG